MTTIDTTKYPHVREYDQRVIRAYEARLNNTGGNDAVELLNDFNTPNSNIMRSNVVRFALAMAVHAQLTLLLRLMRDGELPPLDGGQAARD